MAQDFSTPLSRVLRDGAAGEGAGHFIAQRASAIALAVLTPFMLALALISAVRGEGAFTGALTTGWGAIASLLFFTAALYHMRLGLQVVIEDYIHGSASRIVLLLANAFIAAGLWVAVSASILKIAFGG